MTETQKDKNANEKILFQCVMNYKAYRRKMIAIRLGITLAAVGGLMALCVVSVLLAIILSVSVICIGVIFILAALSAEQTYTVYSTHVVLKRRGSDKRTFINTADVVEVKYRSALYERGLSTGTITIFARTDKGVKKYRMRHVFNAAPVVEFLRNAITENTNEDRK